MCINCKTSFENGSCMLHVVTMKKHFTIISFVCLFFVCLFVCLFFVCLFVCVLWFSAASSDYGRTKWEVHSYSYLAQHFAQSYLLE